MRGVNTWDVHGFELIIEDKDGAQEHILWKNVHWISVQRQAVTAKQATQAASKDDDDDEGEESGGSSKLIPPTPGDEGDVALEEPREEADSEERIGEEEPLPI